MNCPLPPQGPVLDDTKKALRLRSFSFLKHADLRLSVPI
jgi:hypothetical protein